MQDSVQLYLNTENGNHNDDYKEIIIELLELFHSTIGQAPPLGYKPLWIAYGPCPMCFTDHLTDHYLIHVTESPVINDWCRFVYEFSHEFCHIYCDPRVNNWLIETFCDLASIYFLDKMGTEWQAKGITFGDHFLGYKHDYIASQLSSKRLEGYNLDRTWLKKEIQELKASVDRELNSAVAIELFPSFKANPDLWKLLPYLSKSTGIKFSSLNELHDNTIINFNELESYLSSDGLHIDLGIIRELYE